MTVAGLVIGIYRRRNGAQVRELLATGGDRFRAALWALDSVAPELSDLTAGDGPGQKFELLNRLLTIASPHAGEAVVVVDDDISFVRGSLEEFVDISAAAAFDLAQPAHARGSHLSHEITRQRRLSIARLTTFVEIGPLFVCMPRRRSQFMPFPGDVGMGWGLDLTWHDRHREGAALGIVDRVALRHHVPPGGEYDIEALRESNSERLRRRGVERMADVQAVLATWRPWQKRPPWNPMNEAGALQ